MMSGGIDIPGKGRRRALSAAGIMKSSPPVYTWVSDNAVTACHRCGVEFGFLTRRHHCRMCGRIFCDACSRGKAVIPPRLRAIMPSSPPGVLHGFLSAPSADQPRRVCDGCRDNIGDHQRSERLIGVLGHVMRRWHQLDNECMKRLRLVSRRWSKAALFYLKRFHRLVRARLPADTPSHKELQDFAPTVAANAVEILCGRPQLLRSSTAWGRRPASGRRGHRRPRPRLRVPSALR